ncbi:hypothetical protein MKEN_00370700 [Mycena kentingensis (nom. inval.)]|nr:hypothetical protein MKEN_00370700 [Mycena kentingensis (nom. inval.)]
MQNFPPWYNPQDYDYNRQEVYNYPLTAVPGNILYHQDGSTSRTVPYIPDAGTGDEVFSPVHICFDSVGLCREPTCNLPIHAPLLPNLPNMSLTYRRRVLVPHRRVNLLNEMVSPEMLRQYDLSILLPSISCGRFVSTFYIGDAFVGTLKLRSNTNGSYEFVTGTGKTYTLQQTHEATSDHIVHLKSTVGRNGIALFSYHNRREIRIWSWVDAQMTCLAKWEHGGHWEFAEDITECFQHAAQAPGMMAFLMAMIVCRVVNILSKQQVF